MMVLSLSRPWPWVILRGGKRVENRKWPPPLKMVGEVIALHAANSWDNLNADISGAMYDLGMPMRTDAHPSGVIVGVARIVAIVGGPAVSTATFDKYKCLTPDSALPREQRERFFFGPFGWVLDEVRELRTPVKQKGAQGLRALTPEVERAITFDLAGITELRS